MSLFLKTYVHYLRHRLRQLKIKCTDGGSYFYKNQKYRPLETEKRFFWVISFQKFLIFHICVVVFFRKCWMFREGIPVKLLNIDSPHNIKVFTGIYSITFSVTCTILLLLCQVLLIVFITDVLKTYPRLPFFWYYIEKETFVFKIFEWQAYS